MAQVAVCSLVTRHEDRKSQNSSKNQGVESSLYQPRLMLVSKVGGTLCGISQSQQASAQEIPLSPAPPKLVRLT